MPLTPTQFKANFPEFTNASDALVQVRLDWAYERTDSTIWGDKLDQGAQWLTAHMLSLLPEAKDLRKGEKPGESMYQRERHRLNRVVSSGFRIAGED